MPRLYPSVRPKHGALLKGTFPGDVIDGTTARRKVRNEEDLFFFLTCASSMIGSTGALSRLNEPHACFTLYNMSPVMADWKTASFLI